MRVYNFDDGGIFGESEIGESCAVHTDDDFGVIEEVNLLLQGEIFERNEMELLLLEEVLNFLFIGEESIFSEDIDFVGLVVWW